MRAPPRIFSVNSREWRDDNALRILADLKQQEAAHDELQTLRARVARLEEAIRLADADITGDTPDALRRMAGDPDSSVDG